MGERYFRNVRRFGRFWGWLKWGRLVKGVVNRYLSGLKVPSVSGARKKCQGSSCREWEGESTDVCYLAFCPTHILDGLAVASIIKTFADYLWTLSLALALLAVKSSRPPYLSQNRHCVRQLCLSTSCNVLGS